MNTDDERKENEFNRKANHSTNSDFLNVNGDLLCSFEPNDLGNIQIEITCSEMILKTQ